MEAIESFPLKFSQILTLMKVKPNWNYLEKLYKLRIQDETHKNHILKYLRWILFQYQRDIFLSQEVIEFLKFGNIYQVRAFCDQLCSIGVRPFKRSWMNIVHNYSGPKNSAIHYYPDIGELISKHFFDIIDKEESDHKCPGQVTDIKVNLPNDSLLKKSIKFVINERKPIFKVHTRLQNVKRNIPVISTGCGLDKVFGVPNFFSTSNVEKSIMELTNVNRVPPKFVSDIPLYLTFKCYGNKKFSHGKSIIDLPDIMWLDKPLDLNLYNCLFYNYINISNQHIYISKVIDNYNAKLGTIADWVIGVDILLNDRKLTIPFYWKVIKEINGGYIIIAPDIKWNLCLSKIIRLFRDNAEKLIKIEDI